MISRKLISFILGFLFLQNLLAQEMCRHLFEQGAKSHLENATSTRKIKSKLVANVLKKAKEKLGKAQFIQFRDFYMSHFFYGRNQVLMGTLNHPDHFSPQTFVRSGEDPFLAYMIARENVFEKELQDVLTIDGLAKIQSELLKEHDSTSVNKEYGRIAIDSSENTTESDLGALRTYAVINKVNSERVYGTMARANVNDKARSGRAFRVEFDSFDRSKKDYAPNLSDKKDPNPEKLEHLVAADVDSPHTYSELEKENSFIHKEYDYIEYAGIEKWKKYTSVLSPELILKLKAAEAEGLFSKQSPRLGKLRQSFLAELVNNEVKNLFVGIEQFNGNQNAQVDIIAKFYWSMVSIHPFANGNGRTLRLMLERVLHEVNLPPPVWTYFEQDAFRSLTEFTHILKESIYVSKWFHSDLLRLNDFEPIEIRQHMSMYLLPPPLLSKLFSELAKENRPELRRIEPSLEEFEKFSWLNYKTDARENYLDSYMKWHFQINKTFQSQEGHAGIGMIPKNYADLFAAYSKSETEYKRKKEYYSDEVIYRGTSEKGELDLDAAVNSFLKMTELLQGNGYNYSRHSMTDAFDLFNLRILQKDKINAYVDSQIRGSPNKADYWNSLMSSWSTNVVVAQKYADSKYLDVPEKGYTALVEAFRPKYGAFTVPELNDALGLRYKKSTEEDLVVVGTILPEMIQRMHFVQGTKKKGFFDKMFGANEELNSNIFTVERLNWNTLQVTELHTGKPFLNTKQYKVQITRDGYRIMNGP